MSTKSNYCDMFQSPLFSKEEVNAVITNARKDFKRSDIVLWFLKHYKYSVIKKAIAQGGPEDHVEERKWLSRFEQKHPAWKDNEPKTISHAQRFLQHNIDLNISQINEFRITNESFDQLSAIFDGFETEWRETLDFEAVEEYGTKIVSFPDGSAWFDLERSGCQIEANAMGHCGNGYGQSGQTLLSYRRPINTPEGVMWSSRLTFVLNKKTGVLGEMKGRANERPAERYHPYIVELLKKDIIKKLVGGGYKPEENFALSHLNDDFRNTLLDEKPSLFSTSALAKIYSGCLDKCPIDIASSLRSDLNREPIIINEERWYPLHSGVDKEDICKTFSLKELPKYIKTLDDQYMSIDYMSDIKHHSYTEETLDGLMEQFPDTHSRLVNELMQRIDQDDLDGIDLNTSRGLIKALLLEDDDLEDAVKRALHSGDEMGAMNELEQAFDKFLKRPFDETNQIILKRGEEDPDNSFSLVVSEQYIFDLMLNDDFSEDEYEPLSDSVFSSICNNEKRNDLNVPYYGFSDFDQDGAIESLHNNLIDMFPEINEEIDQNISATTPFESDINPEAIAKFSCHGTTRSTNYGDSEMTM